MSTPPQPVWECKDCGHKIFLKKNYQPFKKQSLDPVEQFMKEQGSLIRPDEEAPKQCPKCKSTNIFSTHLQVHY